MKYEILSSPVYVGRLGFVGAPVVVVEGHARQKDIGALRVDLLRLLEIYVAQRELNVVHWSWASDSGCRKRTLGDKVAMTHCVAYKAEVAREDIPKLRKLGYGDRSYDSAIGWISKL